MLPSFSGNETPFKKEGGTYIDRNQPADIICLGCTSDIDPGEDSKARRLPAVNQKPILIAIFNAGAKTESATSTELGEKPKATLKINNEEKEPLRKDLVLHNISFPAKNPFDEPVGNNPDYFTAGFYYKIPAGESDSVNTIECEGSSEYL